MDPTASQPLTGSTTLDHVLAILGALVPLFSALAGFLNARVRKAQSEGNEVSSGMLRAVAVLNLAAVNVDKAAQLAALAAGKPVATTTPRPGIDAPKP
jgi:hypothetical protein